jgi:hypothetical protein
MGKYMSKKMKIEVPKMLAKKKVARPGVHGKTKVSMLKASKLYKKMYKGQGK